MKGELCCIKKNLVYKLYRLKVVLVIIMIWYFKLVDNSFKYISVVIWLYYCVWIKFIKWLMIIKKGGVVNIEVKF